METPAPPLTLNEAFSGISGSISLASWVFLLLPQLYENYTTQSAAGISIFFLLIWALGDLFNLLGAVWARLVPTVIALAFYFTLSDSILILQCVYYNHWVNKRQQEITESLDGTLGQPREGDRRQSVGSRVQDEDEDENEGQPLLSRHESNRSYSSIGLPGSHLHQQRSASDTFPKTPQNSSPVNTLYSFLRKSFFNAACVIGVCAVGTLGWLIAYKVGAWVPAPPERPNEDNEDRTPFGAELLGYLSAVLYLGARIPQIFKNWKEKSCEGLSFLFFLLSLLGNLTYGAGILAHSLQKQYILTNVPWLLGSLGTMIEDIVSTHHSIIRNPVKRAGKD